MSVDLAKRSSMDMMWNPPLPQPYQPTVETEDEWREDVDDNTNRDGEGRGIRTVLATIFGIGRGRYDDVDSDDSSDSGDSDVLKKYTLNKHKKPMSVGRVMTVSAIVVLLLTVVAVAVTFVMPNPHRGNFLGGSGGGGSSGNGGAGGGLSGRRRCYSECYDPEFDIVCGCLCYTKGDEKFGLCKRQSDFRDRFYFYDDYYDHNNGYIDDDDYDDKDDDYDEDY